MMDDLNIAVIGLARMGRIHARSIDDLEGARLFAVATTSLASEVHFLADYDVPHVFDDARDAFALEEVDAVVIATPTDTHRDLVIAAAEAGKAIFCEKPLALSLDDTHRMLEAVERAAVPLQVGFMRRYDPQYIRAKAAIEAGDIGRPVTFKSVGRDPSCPHVEFANPARSGGLIVDMAIHDMDLARWLMGIEIERVTAEGTVMVCSDLRAAGDIDNAVINLRFENGAIGNVEVSRNAFYGYDIRTEVLGSKAAVKVGGDELNDRLLLSAERPIGGAISRAGDYLTRRFGTAYRDEIRDFLRCIREKRQPTSSGADALAAFEVSLAATYAAETGECVYLEDVRRGWTPEAMEHS